MQSQAHSGTYLKRALAELHENADWRKLDRLIVITDEQSADGLRRPTLRGDGGGFPDGGLVGGGDIFFGTAEALDTSG